MLAAAIAGTAPGEPKRERPDYGAPPQPTTPGDVALWVPRVVLFAPWLVSEYLVRRPLGALVSVADRQQWPVQFVSFFTFGERRQITLLPSAFVDLGLKPSVGFNLRWRYFLAESSTLRLNFGTWGPDWVSAKLVEEYEFGESATLSLQASVNRRKDWPYYGVGGQVDLSPSSRYRYQATNYEVLPGAELRPSKALRLEARTGLRGRRFGEGSCCGNPSIQSGVESGALAEPPGFDDGFTAAYQSLRVMLDTRGKRPESQSGVGLELHGAGSFAPGEQERSWITYGGGVRASLDLWQARTLTVGAAAELVDPLLGEVPFTDLVSVGGDRPMRGFIGGGLRDRSAAVATLRYSWPVWVFLDGAMQVDVGNVFGERLSGLSADQLRLSTGIGLRSTGDPDSAFEILVAGGTEPFGEGLRYSSFRLVIGTHHGF